MPRGNWTNAGW